MVLVLAVVARVVVSYAAVVEAVVVGRVLAEVVYVVVVG